MNNFEFGMDTKIVFGKDQIWKLADEIPKHGKNILLVYGGGSIQRNGVYDSVISVLKSFGANITELSGVDANPHVSTAREGAALCKENTIEAIVAVGGGSVIDCSKLIAAGAKYEGDCWELVKHPILIQEAIPVYVVSTIAASGSDIDCAAVIMNEETKEKEVFGASACSPQTTILDPTYTYSVPAKHTAAGTADMMLHILEDYLYREGDSSLSDRMMEAVLKTMVENGPKALADPEDYNARANLMWAASLATSGILNFGRGSGSATIHWIEGVICGYYNTTHGEVLAQLLPVWMEHILCEKNVVAFSELASHVFGLEPSEDKMETARAGIEAIKHFFFEELNIPSRLSSGGVTDEYFRDIAKKAITYPLTGGNVDLTEDDVYEILKKAL